MKNLYEVRTKRYYKSYYVLANGFDEAKIKAERFIVENDTQSILTEDGNLKLGYSMEDTIKGNIKWIEVERMDGSKGWLWFSNKI